jgi:hypothetical protein
MLRRARRQQIGTICFEVRSVVCHDNTVPDNKLNKSPLEATILHNIITGVPFKDTFFLIYRNKSIHEREGISEFLDTIYRI